MADLTAGLEKELPSRISILLFLPFDEVFHLCSSFGIIGRQ